jgi:hypothetical protein
VVFVPILSPVPPCHIAETSYIFHKMCHYVSYFGGCPQGLRWSNPELVAPKSGFIRTPIDNATQAQLTAGSRRASDHRPLVATKVQPNTGRLYPPLLPPPMARTSFTSASPIRKIRKSSWKQLLSTRRDHWYAIRSQIAAIALLYPKSCATSTLSVLPRTR